MTDVLASVCLGVAGFFLPGIFKSFVTRKRTMTLGAREARDALVFESLFDPLAMRRWFQRPKEMQQQQKPGPTNPQTVDGRERPCVVGVLFLPVVLALCTQFALVLLQLATTREAVSVTGTEGPGVTLTIPVPFDAELNAADNHTHLPPRVSRCLPTPTGSESRSSITTCFEAFFLLAGFPDLRNDQYRLKFTRTFADGNNTDAVIFAVELASEVFIRLATVTPRIITASEEAFLSIHEENITETNDAMIMLAKDVLFPDDVCLFSEVQAFSSTLYQRNWLVNINCLGPPYVLGNNAETSSRFNRFTRILAGGFEPMVGRSRYYKDSNDTGIATSALDVVEVEYYTTTKRVLSDRTILGILVVVVLLKLLTDVVFGEDVLYKTTVLIEEVVTSNDTKGSGSQAFFSLLQARGKLKFEDGGYVRRQSTATPMPSATSSSVHGCTPSASGQDSDDSDDECSV